MSEEEKANYKIKIPDFVEWELDYFRQSCNFSDDELKYFNLKAKNKSIAYISIEMNISEPQVSKIARRVKNKMIKVL